MPSYQISFTDFLKEVKSWKINQNSLHKIKMQEFNDYLQFSFSIPNTSDEYVCTISKDDMTDVDRMELSPITIAAIRLSENVQAAKMISAKLDELRLATLAIPKVEEK